MTRHPSGTDLSHAATGPWASRAACANQPAYTDQDPDAITATCRACRVAADCAKLGRLELARALGDNSDRGEQRVYAGHQLADLLALARSGKAGRNAAYQALTGFDVFGHNCSNYAEIWQEAADIARGKG